MHRGKHPQGFREGGVRGGRELGHLRGRPPWPLEAHFAQKLRQSRSHEFPLPKKLQKDDTKYLQGCHIGRFIEILSPQSGLNRNILTIILRFSLLSPSHPNGATWCQKGSKMRALGPQSAPKWSQVGPQGSPGVPKVPPNVQKDHLWKLPGTEVGPKVAQVLSRGPFLSGF